MPNYDDYYGALTALFRLQETYLLKPKHFLNKSLSQLYPTYKEPDGNFFKVFLKLEMFKAI